MTPDLARALAPHGLAVTGAFHPGPADGVPAGTGTLCLVGAAPSGAMWASFAASAEAADGEPDPLDRWSRRTIAGIAGAVGAVAVFPFDGPPYPPFIAWAKRAEGARPSPLGMLVTPSRGLWVSWRGALALPGRLPLAAAEFPDPCLRCPAPCVTACPVGALGGDAPYDVPRCTAHVRSPAGVSCRAEGCRVRDICPAGIAARPPEAQRAFHMAAFLAAHPPPGD